MSRREFTMIGLGVLILAQLAVPLSMIQKRELALRSGQVFRFRTAPVDPYDAFRGRYVALSVVPNTVPVPAGSEFRRGQRVYALVATNAQGFATFSGMSLDRPDHGDYISVTARYHHSNQSNLAVRVPFDRYYMNEKIAPEAERVYREHSRASRADESRDAYVTVRVRRGFAVLEELYVADTPIAEFVKADGK